MSDPSALRLAASRCRSAAGRIRELASPVPDGVLAVSRRHPVERVWAGPNANTFTDGVNDATRAMKNAVQDALDYADALIRRAGQPVPPTMR